MPPPPEEKDERAKRAAPDTLFGAAIGFFLTLRAVHVILYLKGRGHFEKNRLDFWLGIRDFWKKGKTGFALFQDLSVCSHLARYIALDYDINNAEAGKGMNRFKMSLTIFRTSSPCGRP